MRSLEKKKGTLPGENSKKMYAQFDNIIFQPLTGFDSFSETENSVLAVHLKIYGKPRVQPMAMDLQVVNVTLRLHQEFVDVESAYQSLKKLQTDAKSCALLWGNGKLHGYFYISSMGSTVEQQDATGNIYSRLVSIELLEDAEQNKIARDQAEADKNAKAVGDKQPVNSTSTNAPTCKQRVAKLLNSIDRYNTVFQSTAISDPATDDQNYELRTNLNGLYTDLINLRKITIQLGDCTNRSAELDLEVTNTQASLEIISPEVPVVDIAAFTGLKDNLNTRVSTLLNEGRSISMEAESRQE